jgi:hypothetical protein
MLVCQHPFLLEKVSARPAIVRANVVVEGILREFAISPAASTDNVPRFGKTTTGVFPIMSLMGGVLINALNG